MTMYEENCGEIWVLDLSTSNTSSLLPCLIVLNSIFLCSTIFLNLSAIVIIWKLDDVPGSNRVILLNLSLADLLSGFFSQLIWIIFMVTQVAGHQLCALATATTFCGFTLWAVSFSILVLASIERYLCIFHPFLHERISSSKLFTITVVCVWLTGLSMSILYQFETMKKPLEIISAVFNSVGCCIMALVYARVFHLAYKVRREIRQQADSVNNQPTENQSKGRRGSVNMKALVVALTLLFYFPYSTALYMTTLGSTKINAVVFSILWTFALANASFNPICYFMLNKALRKKMLDLWRYIFKRDATARDAFE